MYVTRGNPNIREVLGDLEFEGHVIKKFIIFDQFQWNFVHSINTLLEYFSKVSLKLIKKCLIMVSIYNQQSSTICSHILAILTYFTDLNID